MYWFLSCVPFRLCLYPPSKYKYTHRLFHKSFPTVASCQIIFASHLQTTQWYFVFIHYMYLYAEASEIVTFRVDIKLRVVVNMQINGKEPTDCSKEEKIVSLASFKKKKSNISICQVYNDSSVCLYHQFPHFSLWITGRLQNCNKLSTTNLQRQWFAHTDCRPDQETAGQALTSLWGPSGGDTPKFFLINVIASCAPLLHLLWETVYVYVYTKEAPPAVCPINPVNKSGGGGGTDFCPLGARWRRTVKFGFNHCGRAGLGTAPAGTQAL